LIKLEKGVLVVFGGMLACYRIFKKKQRLL